MSYVSYALQYMEAYNILLCEVELHYEKTGKGITAGSSTEVMEVIT